MYATAEAKKKGYDQVLWTDAFEHKYVQECGTMNVFLSLDNTAITPDWKPEQSWRGYPGSVIIY